MDEKILERVLRRGQRARLGEVHGVLDFRLDGRRNAGRVRGVEELRPLEVGPQPRDGIALAAGLDLAALCVR